MRKNLTTLRWFAVGMLCILSIAVSSPALSAVTPVKAAGQTEPAGGVDQPGPTSELWVDLTRGERAAADKLGYTQAAWDAEVIRKPNDDVNEFWNSYAYEDLTQAERAAWTVLGWNSENWMPTIDVPQAEYTQWANLKPAEQAAAAALGYTEATWGKYVRVPIGKVEDFWVTIDEHGGYEDLTPGERALFKILGWDAGNWDDGTGAEPETNTTAWAQLTPAEQTAASGLGYVAETWNSAAAWSRASELAAQRNVEFADLMPAAQELWGTLGWNAENWNGAGAAPASRAKSWTELAAAEQAAAGKLGYSPAAWDASVVHVPDGDVQAFWNAVDYGELTPAEREAWAVLGWNAENWTAAGEVPATEYNRWADLTTEEQEAATTLGFDEKTWGTYVRVPDGNVEDFWVAFPFATLTPREQELWGVLGWHAENWEDGAGDVPASNTTLWADLTADEQAAAAALGYDEASWDDANTWSLAQELAARRAGVTFAELPPQMQKRWAILGWNAKNWNFPADEPASMSRFSSQLTAEEQIAAAEVGYSETMWDMSVIRKPDGDVNQFWNSFAYDDLTRAEQAAWAALGWNIENWTPGGEVPAAEYKAWAGLAPEEQAAAKRLGYDEQTWGNYVRVPESNVEEFWGTVVLYSDLTPAERELFAVMGWNAGNWEEGTGKEPTFNSLPWAQIPGDVQGAAAALGYDEDTWNAAAARSRANLLAAQWNSVAFADLTQDEQELWGALGWTAEIWDNAGVGPESATSHWADLTPEEQAAASELGYDEQAWDVTFD